MHDSIPQFAVSINDEAVLKEAAEVSQISYEQRNEDFEKARNYNLKYDRKLLKRLSTWREYQILRRLLGQQKRCATLLEIPCGGDRISPQLENATEMLIQADVGLGQILFDDQRKSQNTPDTDDGILPRFSHRPPVFNPINSINLINTMN